ncbi:NAD(+) diphosphatase [Thalassorhabdomicrobium marinisediminis]|uniref:NAD(+) diphosphatase n=1 Tax=Thalassorhabdomicrobium marinisediminis TaxID=2170577 RepID=A0A2T7FYR4_9RHOB|nr:NAD(+) diphosphatase [Thalassorhabdomicrobium marinisediminis]PVA07278.1 NAD(+) diphosphatase [Thalassorhabdomicrobium marinisediminis]
MEHAETVTFGGSGLNRAAHLRGAIAETLADPAARCIVLWRGKPLLDGAGAGLSRVPLDHPVLGDASDMRLFLGLDEGGPVFAAELTRWDPDVSEAADFGAFLDPSQQHHPAMPAAAHFAELRAVMTTLSARDAELAATARAVIGWHGSHRFCSTCGAESAPDDAGWRRVCPACGTFHFPRTDPVVIMLILSGDNVLLGRSPGWPEGMYSLLAGFVEPGETIEAAVRREVFEEAGIAVGPVRYLASQPWAFPSSLMIGCLGLATSTEITLDPVELEDAVWVSRTDMARVAHGTHPTIKPARAGAIAHFLLENWLADSLD